MKKIILYCFAIFGLCTNSFAQKNIVAEDITIDFDRVIHIVLTTGVEYVAAGSNYVEATIVNEAPNIVRIVALEENFSGMTNVTIIAKNGSVYSYNISYKEDKEGLSVFYPDAQRNPDFYTIKINNMNAGHLIFPNDVVYFKQGNEQRFAVETTTTANVLKVRCKEDLTNAEKSNLFCVDKKGNDYNVSVSIGNNTSYIYQIADATNKANVVVNEGKIEDIAKEVLSKKRNIWSQGFKKNKYEFSLNALYVHNEQLFFLFEIQNKSNIDLDIDFVKCFFIDEKENKNVAQQDIEVESKYQFNFENKIVAKSNNKFILVFNKFTIPDKKIFKIEIYEKGGGRHINFKIKNNVVIAAEAI